MDARIQLVPPLASVCRDGGVERIPASELTPGDIVVLQRGDPVPADCQLIQCDNLRIQEAALTGESAPVDKTPSPFDASGPPTSDRRAMAFMGTVVVAGHGLGVVTATGARTQWGRIAALTQTVQRKRQPRPHAEERQIVAVVLLIIIGVLLILGILHGVLSMTIAALVAAGAIRTALLVGKWYHIPSYAGAGGRFASHRGNDALFDHRSEHSLLK